MQSKTLTGHVLKSIAILSLVAALAASGLASAQSGTVVKVSPTTSQVSVDGTVTVDVVVENVSNLAAVELRLAYNPTVLSVVSITEGGFFTPAAGTLVKRDAVGVIRYEAEASAPASGNGTLVSIVFKGRAAGTANLTFSTAFLGNETGGSISATSQGGQVSVGDASATTVVPTTVVPTTAVPSTTYTPSATPAATRTPTHTPGPSPSHTPTPTSGPPSAAFVKLSPASAQVNVGATVAVEVQVENASNLSVVELRLAYNSTLLEMVSITEGAFLTPKAGTLVKDSTSNVIRYEVEASSPASGNGTLVSIVFKGRAPGAANLAFTSLFLGNPQGGSISATSQGGQVSVSGVEVSVTPVTITPTPITPTSSPTPSSTPLSPTPVSPTPVSPTPVSPTPTHTPKPAMPTPVTVIPTPPSPTPYPVVPTTVPTLVPTQVPTLTSQDIGVHTVQRDETLYCVGRAYLVNPLAIAARNGLGASSFIYPGQRLIIPGQLWTGIPAGRICFRQFALPESLSTPQPGATPAPVPTLPASPQCSLRYTIRYGDTLWSIARRYGKSPWALATYNHIYNPDLIFVNDVLCIP